MSVRRLLAFLPVLAALAWNAPVFAADPTKETALPPIVDYLTPAEEAKTFFMQDGYRMELVLSDPIIKEPTLTVFDGNGRMFVSEMRSYMQDIDGSNEHTKVGRVSVHWSSRKNGVYDKHAIFADNLILPRMILPLANGVVINETDSDDFWLYTDTKGNGVADKKVLFYSGGGRGGNLEHQASGLVWAIDNWLYMTENAYRLKVRGTNVIREQTPPNVGQWGASQDDYGKMWYVNAGAECGPMYYQMPPQYGYLNASDQQSADFQVVYPLIGLADVQGGTIRFRPKEKSLNHFTATCGDDVYRGDRLPADLRGDLLFCEPVGRLIRRAKVETRDGVTYLRNAYDQSEFIRSTDPNFRPVNLVTAPDGTIYITDMYRGIIQEAGWVGQGSYLRGVVQQYQLDKNFGRGRIWRLVQKDFKPGPQPHFQDEKPAKLVQYLAHPNGWWRDTAQKLIILRGDKSVVPALTEMARSHPNHLARIHALWTLEGLEALTPDLVREKIKDGEPQVRIAAIRASETLYKNGDHSLVPDIQACAKDKDPLVVLQVMETASMLKWPNWNSFIAATVAASPSRGVKETGSQLAPGTVINQVRGNSPATAPVAAPVAPPQFTASERQLLKNGGNIYVQLCFGCHGMDGKGAALAGAAPGMTMAPPLGGSRTATGPPDGIISVVLKGLTGPVNGSNYTAQMVPMESNDDAWVAAAASYVRNNFGNHSTLISTNEVALVRAEIKSHTNAWTLEELHDRLPQPLTNRAEWKLTASHNPGWLPRAVDGNPRACYDTHSAQTPGMWVQIELPEETQVCGVDLDTSPSVLNYPRGYKVELSVDGANWGEPVATGHATAAHNQIFFPTASAKLIRITQTGSDPSYVWSIYELQVLRYLTAEELLQPAELFPPLDGKAAAPTTPAKTQQILE